MYCVYNNTQLHLMIFHELFLRDVIADRKRGKYTTYIKVPTFIAAFILGDAILMPHISVWKKELPVFSSHSGRTEAHYSPLLCKGICCTTFSIISTVLSLQQNQQ